MTKEDISRKTLVVLVILTVFLSMLSSWVILMEVGKVRAASQAPSVQKGKVVLTLLEDPNKPHGSSAATGQVVLDILPSKTS